MHTVPRNPADVSLKYPKFIYQDGKNNKYIKSIVNKLEKKFMDALGQVDDD